MARRRRWWIFSKRAAPWRAALLWMIALLPLTRWGTPDPRDTLLLFDQHTYPGINAQAALTARANRTSGADTDLDPLRDRANLVHLNPTTADNDAIFLRYRLYSRQPDEMISFMALQRMQPREFDFDPRLYQYGGAYIYGIGAALGAGHLLGYVDIRAGLNAYLEDPHAFARFYIVARVLSLIAAGFALVAVWKLACRIGGRRAGWFAWWLAALSPVLIAGALEAKPHVPSAALLLWAVVATLTLLHGPNPRRRGSAIRLGVFGGAAFAFVLTGLAAAALWPIALLARGWNQRGRQLLTAGAIFLALYALTNPYLIWNALFDRAALSSNLGNSTAMYSVAEIGAGAIRVGQLLIEGAGYGVVLLGTLALVIGLLRRPRTTLAIAAPALALLALTAAIGAGKPAEFGRFLVAPVMLLCVGAGWLARTGQRRHVAFGLLALLACFGTMRSLQYVRAFALDASYTREARHRAAIWLRAHAATTDPIAVVQEPAPYAIPPLAFANHPIWLLPPAAPARLDPRQLPSWLVFTADDASVHADAWWQRYYAPAQSYYTNEWELARITWANKPVFIYARNPEQD